MTRSQRSLTALFAAFVLLTGTGCAALNQLADDIPRLTDEQLVFKPPQSSKIYASDGTLITTLHEEQDRTVIPLERIPEVVRQAVIAIEDERFYDHGGVDWQAIARAAVTNARTGEITEGGSTITQQYVKNMIIAPGQIAEQTLERKFREAALARQLEERLSKDEILERYLNTVYFGEGAYGIQAAAKTYFGKAAVQLDLHEAALLAAIIRSPATYTPLKKRNREAALARRNLVLDKMAELGYVSEAEAAAAKARKLGVVPRRDSRRYPAPYFVDYVLRTIKYDRRFRALGKTPAQREKALFTGGYRIHTTVDLDMQAAAEEAWRQVLTEPSDPHAALVAVDPATGQVRAMVGGRDYFARRKEDPFAKLNLAIAGEPGLGEGGFAPGTGRQAGSAFKPFGLAAALESGGKSLASVYDAPACITLGPEDTGAAPYRACNYSGEGSGAARLTLLDATVRSVNTVFVQLAADIGPDKVVDMARRLGIRTPLTPVLASILGTEPVNALGMASAYATFASGGIYHPPVAVTRIVGPDGRVVYQDPGESQRVLDTAVSYFVTTALQQVILRGTGIAAQIGRPAAGKTGTAQEYRDAWFAGYTPNLAAAVWVGYPEGQIEMKPACAIPDPSVCRPTRIQVTGGSWPAQIWQAFMLRATVDLPADSFEAPVGGVVTVTIDARTGCLADRFTPDSYRVEATFARGQEPTESCRVPGDAVRVPNVLGFPVRDATRVLEDEGFAVEVVEEETNDYPPGRVIAQQPGPNRRAVPGSTVTLTVSARPGEGAGGDEDGKTVPVVLGLTRAQAEKILRDEGFEVDVIVERESDDDGYRRRRGRVWKQSPPGGSDAPEGSVVTIWVNP